MTRTVVYRIHSPRSLIILVLVLLGLISIVYIRGFMTIASLQREITQVDQEIFALQLRNEQIREEIIKLQSPEYVEGTARRDLGLIKPGETVYRIAEPVEGSW
jgi:cell division protein FtsB